MNKRIALAAAAAGLHVLAASGTMAPDGVMLAPEAFGGEASPFFHRMLFTEPVSEYGPLAEEEEAFPKLCTEPPKECSCPCDTGVPNPPPGGGGEVGGYGGYGGTYGGDYGGYGSYSYGYGTSLQEADNSSSHTTAVYCPCDCPCYTADPTAEFKIEDRNQCEAALDSDTNSCDSQPGTVLQLVRCFNADNVALFIRHCLESDRAALTDDQYRQLETIRDDVPGKHITRPCEVDAVPTCRSVFTRRSRTGECPAPASAADVNCEDVPTVQTMFQCVGANDELLPLYICLFLDPSISKIAREKLYRISDDTLASTILDAPCPQPGCAGFERNIQLTESSRGECLQRNDGFDVTCGSGGTESILLQCLDNESTDESTMFLPLADCMDLDMNIPFTYRDQVKRISETTMKKRVYVPCDLAACPAGTAETPAYKYGTTSYSNCACPATDGSKVTRDLVCLEYVAERSSEVNLSMCSTADPALDVPTLVKSCTPECSEGADFKLTTRGLCLAAMLEGETTGCGTGSVETLVECMDVDGVMVPLAQCLDINAPVSDSIKEQLANVAGTTMKKTVYANCAAEAVATCQSVYTRRTLRNPDDCAALAAGADVNCAEATTEILFECVGPGEVLVPLRFCLRFDQSISNIAREALFRVSDLTLSSTVVNAPCPRAECSGFNMGNQLLMSTRGTCETDFGKFAAPCGAAAGVDTLLQCLDNDQDRIFIPLVQCLQSDNSIPLEIRNQVRSISETTLKKRVRVPCQADDCPVGTAEAAANLYATALWGTCACAPATTTESFKEQQTRESVCVEFTADSTVDPAVVDMSKCTASQALASNPEDSIADCDDEPLCEGLATVDTCASPQVITSKGCCPNNQLRTDGKCCALAKKDACGVCQGTGRSCIVWTVRVALTTNCSLDQLRSTAIDADDACTRFCPKTLAALNDPYGLCEIESADIINRRRLLDTDISFTLVTEEGIDAEVFKAKLMNANLPGVTIKSLTPTGGATDTANYVAPIVNATAPPPPAATGGGSDGLSGGGIAGVVIAVLIVVAAAVAAAFYFMKKRASGSPDGFNDME